MVHWRVEEFGVLDSTQDEAYRMAIEGRAEGTVVVARKQKAGRGRFERSWESPQGGLYMSIILRPAAEGVTLLSLVGALAVLDGIADQTRLSPLIRWPNDVLIEGRKVGGVIAEANFSGRVLSFVILGMGVNCNFPASALGGLLRTSTTLKDILEKDVDILSLRRRTLDSLGRSYGLLKDHRSYEILRRVRSVLSTEGKSVRYETIDGRRGVGVAVEMLDDGSLRVADGGGTNYLRPEKIRWLRED